MNDNEKSILGVNDLDEEDFDFDDLEKQLGDSRSELQFLEEDKKKISNPENLGNAVMDVVWDQFVIQIGAVAGEDFIKENRGLKLDLRNEAHIQNAENFAKGEIATHNYISKGSLEQNYGRFKNTPHKQFRKEDVDPGMNATLKRAGDLKKQGIDTVTDIYTGRQIPTETKLENGKNNPKAAQREHVKPSAEVYKNVSLQMANGNEELAAIINDPENLQGYTTAERNNRKSDKTSAEMDEKDKNKHWEEADKRAEEHIKKKEKEGEDRLIAEGRKTQKEEAFRIGGKALRAAVMRLLAELIRNIISKLIAWLKSAEKNLKTFVSQIKEAIATFLTNIKRSLLTAGTTIGSTVLSAIFGPVVSAIQKVWTIIKQGGKSVKEAIDYVKKPENRKKSFGVLMLEVGKIVMTGLTATGALGLGEVIEKALMAFPPFTVEIPLLGSLANIIGIFLGAVVAGIAGALVLNLIDKLIAKKKKQEITDQQIQKGNEVLAKQAQVIAVNKEKLKRTKEKAGEEMRARHDAAHEIIKEGTDTIFSGEKRDNSGALADINNMLDEL